jgi:hypothetical protein
MNIEEGEEEEGGEETYVGGEEAFVMDNKFVSW